MSEAPPTKTLDEAASKRLLVEVGIPIADERVVDDPGAAVAAARELGFPVVAKLCGEMIAHKSERGLVKVGLANADSVESAAEQLLGAARPEDGEIELLVAQMVGGHRELIAGVHRDAQFGLTVMVGVGGVLAEAVGDVSFRLAPFDEVDAEEMIDDLASQSLLGPFRGEPAVDREALVGVLTALSRLATERPDIMSIDVNPLIVSDGRPIAVDALVEVTA